MERTFELFLRDIVIAIEDIQSFVGDMKEKDFS